MNSSEMTKEQRDFLLSVDFDKPIREILTSRDRTRRHRYTLAMRAYKTMRGCSVCGYNKCDTALDFHHVRGEKSFTISGAVAGKNVSWERIVEEMNKCEILCRNCHAERHYEDDDVHPRKEDSSD